MYRLHKHDILKDKFHKICARPVHQKQPKLLEKNKRCPTQKQKHAIFMQRKTQCWQDTNAP